MRPVARGVDPGGYTEYGLAYGALVHRIGRYCSYCEAPLKNGQVEHILPKYHYGTMVLDWSNFLLACGNCNPTKSDWPAPANGGRSAAFWPDIDNTTLAYTYPYGLPPKVCSTLSTTEQGIATSLLIHTGVDRSPMHSRWSEKDDRWEMRNEVWDKAIECKAELMAEDTLVHRKRIEDVARLSGFWSVWRTVFAADVDMLRRLNNVFKGTDPTSFNPRTVEPIARPGGRL